MRPNYFEYEGEYYHIAEFLSLHQGKVYNPSVSRMSRWMAVSRNDFYERVEILAEYLEEILPELEAAEKERLRAEERCREEEKKKKKMGEPENMTIRLLKEVLGDLNV